MLASARWLTVLRGRGGGRDNSQRLGLSLTTCVHDRRGRVETRHTAPGEALVKRRRTRVRFPPPPPDQREAADIHTGCRPLCAYTEAAADARFGRWTRLIWASRTDCRRSSGR